MPTTRAEAIRFYTDKLAEVTRLDGTDGYREKARIVVETREKIERGVEALEGLHVIGRPQLGLVAFGADDVDVFAIWARMKQRGSNGQAVKGT